MSWSGWHSSSCLCERNAQRIPIPPGLIQRLSCFNRLEQKLEDSESWQKILRSPGTSLGLSAPALLWLIKAGVGGPWEPIRKESQGEEEKKWFQKLPIKSEWIPHHQGTMTQTVASAKFQYQLPKQQKGGSQRSFAHWQASTSYPKCIHTWQIKVQVVSLD